MDATPERKQDGVGDLKRLTDNIIVLEPSMLSLALLGGFTHFFEWYSRALY